MFPTLQFNIEEDINLPISTLGKVFLFDFEKKQHVLKDGKPVKATYEQAIKQWVSFLFITELDAYEVYKDTDFGLMIKQFIGRRDLPITVISSELKRQIEEKVILHPEIQSIENFNFIREDSQAIVSFSLITKNGVIDGVESKVKYSG